MKATLLLKKEHEALRQLLNELQNGDRKDRENLFVTIRREMGMHFQIEQELFYSELAHTPDGGAEVAERAISDHGEIEELLLELTNLGVQNKQFNAKLAALVDKVDAHVGFEEGQLFDEIRKVLSEYRLEELGLEMEDRRRFLEISAA